MSLFAQYIAPKAFGSFRKKTKYYFCGDAKGGVVHFAWFNKESDRWRLRLLTITRKEMEQAVDHDQPRLFKAKRQDEMPPWLRGQENRNFEALEPLRPGAPKQTYNQQASKRLSTISEAVDNKFDILAATDPLHELNAYAYRLNVHPHRFQLFFFAYVLHGEDLWTLKKPSMNTGRWDRGSEKHKNKKFGLENADDLNCYNSPGTCAAEVMMASYLARCGLGITLARIWREAIVEDWGCVSVEDAEGNFTYVHPENGPFWSYGQFRYRIVRIFGLEQVQLTLYGQHRVRRKRTVSEGNYTAQYARLMEGVEVDAYYCKELPEAMLAAGPCQPLVVARAICCKSSAVAGVGFAMGKENKEAYRAMLFCCAVSHEYVAKIYGIPPQHFADWITLGVPPNFRSDRGPGGKRDLVDELMFRFPVKSIVPSYTPQAKALGESSHPRDVQTEGPPTYVQSPLTIPKLIKQELYRGRQDTHTSDISARLTDEEISEFLRRGFVATPHCYCKYHLEFLNCAGQVWPVPLAVRTFWTPMKFEVDKDGVKYRHRHYWSDDLKKSGFLEKVGSSTTEVDGFCLSLVFLVVWVEINGRLIEVEATSRARIDKEDLAAPRSAVDAAAKDLKVLKAKTRRSAAAAHGDTRSKFGEATGGERFDSGERKTGRPKISSTANHEALVAKGKTKVKGAK